MDLNEKSENVFNVREQEEKIVSYYGDKERITYIANGFRAAKTINGTSQEFINLSVSFAQNSDHLTACEILECGIEKYPYDVELLSCFLNCAIDSGISTEIEKCKNIYIKLTEVSFSRYTERAFNSVLKYLESKMSFVAPKEGILVKDDAERILDAFRKQYPSNEGSYFAQCDFVDNEEERKNILKEAVCKLASCSRCALRLADILCDKGDYFEARNAVEKCLRSIQTLSSVNRAYAYYLLGICEYGLLVTMDADYKESKSVKDKVKKIYESFKIAKNDYYNLQSVYRKEIERIVFVIEQQSGIAYT